MSIGITIIFPQGVLLVADGRQCRPLKNNELIKDDTNKIQQINSKLFAIHFGITEASKLSIDHFIQHHNPKDNPKNMNLQLDKSVKIDWDNIS